MFAIFGIGQWCQSRLFMRLRPGKSVKHGIALRNIVNAATAPRSAAQQAQCGKHTATERAISLQRFNRIMRASGIVPATRWSVGGNHPLIPTDGTNHPTGDTHRRSRLAALRLTASNSEAICPSNDRKSARAALGLARNTISHRSGSRDSYWRANTRNLRFMVLRVTALPTALETARPSRRPSIAASPKTEESSRTR